MKVFILAASLAVILILSISLCSYADGCVAHTLSSWERGAHAYDINDFGQIVGTIDTTDPGAEPTRSAVLWNRYDSSPQPLDSDNDYSAAYLINNSGLVAGSHIGASGYSSKWTWNATDGLNDVYVDADDSKLFVNAMNNAGSMVGFLVDFPMDGSQNSTEFPVALGADGQITPLDNTCGGVGGHARGINDAGDIVGFSYAPGCDWGHASLWHGSSAVDLGTFGGTWSGAVAINNAGQVVGAYGSDDGSSGNFVWSTDNGTVFIPNCPLLDNGVFGAADINDNDVVLGVGQIDGVDNAVTWSLTGGFTIVGNGNPMAINDSGYVAGIRDGLAVVWQPVPEPGSLVALCAGLIPLAFRRRRWTSEQIPRDEVTLVFRESCSQNV